jgi:ATP-dependent Clp protease ATP-binding subunit ClpB
MNQDVAVQESGKRFEQRRHLDPSRRSDASLEFEESLRRKIVGQQDGVRAFVDLYQVFCADMCPTGRPIGNVLLLGPTGSGKTRIVEAAAEILFGDPRAVIKIDCAEFQHSHEIAKLIGSPPGYLGHRETHPLITQEALARYHKEDLKLSFLLFDEIEKASDSLWQLLLGILDKATLTLGDNRRVDLSQTMIFLTSNLGGGDITKLMTGGMGFVQPKDKTEDRLDHKVERTAQQAAKKKFSPEFMNRLDKVVVFHPLRHEQLEQILEIELGMVQQRVLDTGRGQFLFRVTTAARRFLLQEGTDIKYGARHLKRAIEKFVVYPLANLLATEQIRFGDMLVVDWDGKSTHLSFQKEGEGAVVPTPAKAARGAAAQMAKATGGKVIEAPTQVIVREAKAPSALPSAAPPPVASGRKKVDPQ